MTWSSPTRSTGHVTDASKLRKRFRDAVRRAGVPDLTFHELRHTFGTRMALAGAPLRSLQAWMGHAATNPQRALSR